MLQSSISWIDFSEQDRRKMIEVVALFKQRDTRDELGLGSIRDTLSGLFFPGTSTLQTRARYFLFIPWLYRDYERRKIPSAQIARQLRRDEVKLINALQAAGESDGVIGKVSGASLHRFPSSIYWNGLRRWEILRYSGSQSQYHRWLDHSYKRRPERTDDGEPVTGWAGGNWNIDRLKPPDAFPEQADFRLTSCEADYLRERLLLSCHDSLLATLVDRCESVEDVDFIWAHPQLSAFSEEQRAWIDHAHRFSEAMYGAALLYNLMLSELGQIDELSEGYCEILGSWQEDLAGSWAAFQSWDRAAFWRLVKGTGRIPLPTQHFVNQWLDVLLAGTEPPHLPEHAVARALVRDREVWLKRGRSRFESRRHLEMWSGAAGAFRLDYRWSVARRITNDIIHGFRG